ncbi:MAG: threonylcarbamoyl-AMP synthase [Acidobacteria bacterium]|nr:threonylcarbamoyl-AMP synthase [Acidobacteriota bacterium]
MVHFDVTNPNPPLLEKAAAVIRSGGIVLHPTDTVYGLACDPFQEKSIRRIVELKGRSSERGFLVLIADFSWIHKVADPVPPLMEWFSQKVWPGPVTLLLCARSDVSPLLSGWEGKVGLRLPEPMFLRQWMQMIPGPLLSTSANVSGQPLPSSLDDLQRMFASGVDLFLEGESPVEITPSTVVDLTCRPPRLVRPGKNRVWVETVIEQSSHL